MTSFSRYCEQEELAKQLIALALLLVAVEVAKISSGDPPQEPVAKEKRKRKWSARKDYSTSVWGQFLASKRQELQDPSSRAAKLFQRRFRTPFSLFEKIVAEMKADEMYKDHDEKRDAVGNLAVPLELKVLGALRVLARSSTFDEINELSGMSEDTCRSFFHEFISFWGEDHRFTSYVHPPQTEAELNETLRQYRERGLPGCVGSVDCVHIAWDKCPARRKTLFTGKEGFPTFSFEVVADHNRRIQAATLGFEGSANDKTIVRFDGHVRSIRSNPFYTRKQYQHYALNEENQVVVAMEEGVYLICDGGYHKWRVLQCPLKNIAEPKERAFSKNLESVRKDVECVFGILKIRFKILKYPVRIRSQWAVSMIFRTCCVLHNMLLDYYGRDSVAAAERQARELAEGDANNEDDDDEDSHKG